MVATATGNFLIDSQMQLVGNRRRLIDAPQGIPPIGREEQT